MSTRKIPAFQLRVWQWLKANDKTFDIIHFQETAGFLYFLFNLFRRDNINTIEGFMHSQLAEFISQLKFLLKTPRESLPYLVMPFSILQEYISLKMAKQVITISEHSRSALISWGIKPGKIAAIPCAISKPSPGPEQEKTPRTGPIKFLYIGNLVPRKGVDILIEAVNILKQKGTNNFRVDIVGQGSLFKYCQKQIERNNLQNCSMRGLVSQQELEQLYREADCFICPSRLEGFGIVLLEAAANNLAIIANDIPVFKEIYVEDEVLYFNRNDPFSLAGKMSRVIDRPDLVSSFRERALNKVENYMWPGVIKDYVALYSSMTSQKG